jgi:hypothetical protein
MPQRCATMLLPVVILVSLVAVFVEGGCRLRRSRPRDANGMSYFVILNSYEDVLHSVAPVGSIVSLNLLNSLIIAYL